MNPELYNITNVIEGLVIKRPSKIIKSPYVADITINDNSYLGHTPSLGCCGLANSGSMVLLSKLGEKTKCDYRIELAKLNTGIIVGIAPKLAEKIVSNALLKNLVQHLSVKKFKTEIKIGNSRFDFVGKTKKGEDFILEVKSVPLARNGIAYFPDGYRKNKKQTVSERALKHVIELNGIKDKFPQIRCILLFVIQRNDVREFQIFNEDPIYHEAVKNAWLAGVEIKTIQVQWNDNGKCEYIKNNTPIVLYDNCNIN